MNMNLLVTLDSNYIPPLCTMLRSLVTQHSDDSITLYVAHSTLNDTDFAEIEEALYGCEGTVVPVLLDDALFANAPVLKRISKETYYRLFAPFYLDTSVDRILYIDPDTLILNPLTDFYQIDMTGFALCGSKHFDGFIDTVNRKRLRLRYAKRYVNAGILLMNLEEMRKQVSKEQIFDLIRKNGSVLFLADQDAINMLYDGKIRLFDENIINLDERCFARLVQRMGRENAFRYIQSRTSIVHYNGKYKPWKPDYQGDLDILYPTPEQEFERKEIAETA